MTKPRDRVERETFMRAPIERVFSALTDSSQFPTWGPERVEGTIAPGERPVFDFGISGKVRVYVVALEPPRYFAYRWVQGVHDPEVLLGDPLARPNTLVEFHLDERDGGTRVRVVESEVDKLPMPAELNIDDTLANMGKGWELMLGGLPRHFTFAGGDKVENELVLPAPPDKVRAALLAPASWWMMAPPLEVEAVDDQHVRYRWKRDGATTVIDFALAPDAQGTRLHQVEAGFASLPEPRLAAKRAHQGWGVILGMLQMHLAT